MTEHHLPGLREKPLGSYLAGLGLIRVLGQQDNTLTAWWHDGLRLSTAIGNIPDWLVSYYVPTPVVSPWNEGGAFGADSKAPRQILKRLLDIPSERLVLLRQTTAVADKMVKQARLAGLTKSQIVQQFRNHCPEAVVPWIDAAVVLTTDTAVFPPLLGTGGNDGRLEFSTNFHQRLLDVFEPSNHAKSLLWAQDLLSGEQTQPLVSGSIGQFDPGSAGGRNSSPHGAADSMVNPWAYVLMVEGALLFAASASKRLGMADSSRMAIPFTVDTSPHATASGSDGERTRGEVWAPLWQRPFGYQEIVHLFTEARASWRGRPARRAEEFYQATVTHGVQRGLRAFQRFGLHERNGRAYVAVPLDRVEVVERPAVALIAQLEDWVNRHRSANSNAVRLAVRRFDAARIAFAKRPERLQLRELLAARTRVELAVSRSGNVRSEVQPAHCPPATQYLKFLAAEQVSPALRIAVGVVSARRRGERAQLRHLLLPITVDGRDWTTKPVVPGFGTRALRAVLADVLAYRARTVPTNPSPNEGEHVFRGAAPLAHGIPVPDNDLLSWGDDDQEIEKWVTALLTLDWTGASHVWYPDRTMPPLQVAPGTLGLLLALAHGVRPEGSAEPLLTLGTGWARRLIAGNVASVHHDAVGRLRRAGWIVPDYGGSITGDGLKLAAALTARCTPAYRGLTHAAVLANTSDNDATLNTRETGDDQ